MAVTGAGVAGAGVAGVARVGLAALPTPLVPAPRLAEVVGAGALYVKRDDLTGGQLDAVALAAAADR
jgi:hypothetical protein